LQDSLTAWKPGSSLAGVEYWIIVTCYHLCSLRTSACSTWVVSRLCSI